jgi:hypothetical protein
MRVLCIGVKAINLQYLWFKGLPFGGCLYLEAWKHGWYMNIWGLFKVEFGSYEAEPERW